MSLAASPSQPSQAIVLTDGAGNPVTTYSPNTPITVTVSGNTCGLVLYAKVGNGGDHVGTFTIPTKLSNTMQLLTCATPAPGLTPSGSTVGHSGNIAKSNVQVTWMPPSTATGPITFQGMFTNPTNNFQVYQLLDVTIQPGTPVTPGGPTQVPPATLPPGTTSPPATVPMSPTSVVAEAGNGLVTIMFTPPLNNGGSPIIRYDATCVSPVPCALQQPISVVVSSPQTPLLAIVPNGASYVFRVVAVNALGSSKPVQTIAVTPTSTQSVPNPPTGILVMPQSAAALVTWTLPTSSGGSPITGYIVSAYFGTNGAQPVARVNTIAMSALLTGLIPGTYYQFSVVAVNQNGMSTAAQTAINVFIPVIGSVAVPNMITGLFAAGHDRTVTLTWDRPTTNNIISYVIRNNLGQTMNITGQPVTFDGLMNFVPYTFDIAAVNIGGIGPFSALSNVVVPAALPVAGSPGAPSNVMATANTDGSVTVTWTAGTVGASITTTYTVIASTGDSITVNAADAGVMGTFPPQKLPTGSVSFVVVASNSQGTSQPSMISATVTVVNPMQQMPPQNPTITNVMVGTDGKTVTVMFDPPTDTGNLPILSYTAFTSDMASTVTGPSSPLILTGVVFTDGLSVYVTAANAVGSSMPDPGAAAPIPKPTMMANQTQGFTQRGFSTTWKINPTDQTITFTMTGQCTGYISIGFASGPLMANNADYYTGYIDDNTGTLVFSDTFSTSHAAPAIDGQQDIISATGTQVNGVTSITFTRLLVTPDTAQDYPITNQLIYVHWAIANSDDLISYHSDRDVQLANLFTGQAIAVNLNNTWNASYLLCIIALSIFLFYATVRWVHKFIKSCRHRDHIMTLERTSSSSQVYPVEHSKSMSSQQTSSQLAMVRAQAKSLSEYHAQLSGNTMNDEISENRSLQTNPAIAWGAGSSLSSQQMDNGYGHRRIITSVGPSPIHANSQQQKNWEAQWQPLQTQEGWTYYYNERTQETSWEIPPMPDYFEGRGARYSMASPTQQQQQQRQPISTDSIRIEQIPERSAIPPSAAAARYALAKKSNRLMAQLFAIFHYRIPQTQFSLNQILVFLVYIVINIICVVAVDKQTEMATRWGWLACGNFVLVALPATRNSVLIWVLGYSFDVIMVFHRWIGRFLFLVVSVHMFGWYYLWYQQGLSIYQQQFQNLSYARGFYAWLALLVVQILSLDFFRRRHFEFFYHTHFTFVICYVMAYLHEPQQGPYYTAILIIYLLDRAVRMFWGLLPRKTTLLQAKGGDILQVRFPKHPLARAANLYKVGQYVFVNFPQLSLVQWHPFSISSAPDERTAEIHIRSLGDYTRAMLQKVRSNKQQDLWIRVDGPYGSHRLTYHRYPVLILVGGGIGITPIISILKDIYHVGDFDPRSTPKVNAIEGICCVWVIPNQATYEWFADEFEKLVAASQNPMMPPLFLWVYVTRDSHAGHSNSNFVSGKPDFDHIFSCAAKDYRGKATCVFACGPEMMVGQAWDATNTRKRAGDTFLFHHETFEW